MVKGIIVLLPFLCYFNIFLMHKDHMCKMKLITNPKPNASSSPPHPRCTLSGDFPDRLHLRRLPRYSPSPATSLLWCLPRCTPFPATSLPSGESLPLFLSTYMQLKTIVGLTNGVHILQSSSSPTS